MTINLNNLFIVQDKYELSKGKILLKGILLNISALIAVLPILFLVNLLAARLGITVDDSSANIMVTNLMKNHSLLMLFIVAMQGPLREEATFRLWQSMKKLHITICLFFISLFLLNLIKTNDTYGINIILISTKILISLIIATVFHISVKESQCILIRRNKRLMKTLLLLSCFLFAVMHFENYDVTYQNVLFVLLKCSPQFLGAIILTYLRLNLGFWYAVFWHCTTNFMLAASLHYL
jgi:hypothetical protein